MDRRTFLAGTGAVLLAAPAIMNAARGPQVAGGEIFNLETV
jgi:hypothetical protein